jgi:ABC-type nitrate/sulfonate/bicarbonate transport system permease component
MGGYLQVLFDQNPKAIGGKLPEMTSIMRGKEKYKLMKKAASCCLPGGLARRALMLNKSLLLVTPVAVVQRLFELLPTADFASAIVFSLTRIMLGSFWPWLPALFLACWRGTCALWRWPLAADACDQVGAGGVVHHFVSDLAEFQKPFGFHRLLMVLPVVYTNMLHGIKSTDAKLLEMAALFRVAGQKNALHPPAPF